MKINKDRQYLLAKVQGQRKWGNPSAGFTLLEVLVAMAILGIGLCVILELFSGGLRSAKVSEEYVKATWHGKGKMEEVLSAKDLTEGVTEGSFDSQFSWTLEVKKANPSMSTAEPAGEEGESLPVDLYQVVLKVTWPSGARQRTLELESLRTYKKEEE
jgi:general secretion pathway protein I